MALPEAPHQIKDSKLEYHAFKHPTLFRLLDYILCPFTCGCFHCWITPRDQLLSDLRYKGLPVHKRMTDMHFAREGRKFNRRNSLSIGKPVGKWMQIIKRRKSPSSQTQSPLYAKLPYEIRIEIFKQALFDKGATFIDTAPINPAYWRSFHKVRAQACELDLGTDLGLDDLNTADSGLLIQKSSLDTALLQTCRLVYTEVLSMLYAQTQFVFKNQRHLVAFSHSIPRTHFEHIRSIRLDFSKLSRNYQDRSGRDKITFVNPMFRPMQESLQAIQLIRSLQSIYIVFKITKDVSWSRSDFEVKLQQMQEYQKRIARATTTQCKVHLLVYNWTELVFHKTEQGLLEVQQAA